MTRRFQYAVIASSTCLVLLLSFGAVTVRSAPADEPYVQLGVFTDVLSKIKVDYVEEPDLKAVTLGAINGLLESLDPFASYLNAEQYKQYQAEHGKGKADVGLYLSRGPGYLRIVNVLTGSAADKAKLTTGDVLESINKISTRDMPLAFAEIMLQGEPGTKVEMSVLTPRQSDPENITLTRAPLAYPVVTGRLVAGAEPAGLIVVPTLRSGQVGQIGQKVKELEQQGAKKIVLDLRFAALGPVEEGVALADLFMDSGLITYTQGQKVRRQDFNAKASDTVTKLPVTILMNAGTAGAAEVAAAALLDSKRAQLVGSASWGDAAIRKAVTMSDGGAVILSVAKYYAPSGKAIQDTHVIPDVLQAQWEAGDIADPANPEAWPPPDRLDRVLQKAVPGIITTIK
jgi:carboxyl-terminal processing protease